MIPTPKQIKEAVEKDSDFAHEMRVGQILNKCIEDFKTNPYGEIRIMPLAHGGTYTDHITGKPRQYDYRFTVARGSERLHWALECKNTDSAYPLVVCGRPRTSEESFHEFIESEGYRKVVRVDDSYTLYPFDEFVGKSLVRVTLKKGVFSTEGDSEIYDRWSQAIASCHDIFGKLFNPTPAKKLSDSVMPIVVVPNGSLWTANYSNDGQLEKEPELVNECCFYLGHEIPIQGLNPLTITHIHFATTDGLKNMLSLYLGSRSHKWRNVFGK